MYYYLCHRGPVWNPNETCVLAATIYPDYESQDRIYPAGSNEFGGLTVIGRFREALVPDALKRGAVLFSSLRDHHGVTDMEGPLV